MPSSKKVSWSIVQGVGMHAWAERLTMKEKGTRTRRYPGVYRIDERTFRIRVKALDPRTGKTKEVQKLLEGLSAHEANARRDGLARQIHEGGGERKRDRLGDFAKWWLRAKLPTLKPSTQAKYADALEDHVLPVLGDVYVDAVGHADIVKLREQLGARFAPATVNGILRVTKTLFRDAVAELDLPKDPTIRVKALPEARPDDEPNVLTAGELRKFLDAARTVAPRHHAMLATLALTGMRFGECAALRWEDIDGDVIRIRRSHWHGKVTTTKTGRSRTVPLDPMLAEILRGHGGGTGYVFPTARGTLRVPSSLQKPLRKASKAAGIATKLTVHGLRRTFNNLVRQAAGEIAARAILGHVTERMTEHYSHVGTDEKQSAVRKVCELVAPRESGTGGGTRGDRKDLLN